MKKNILALTFFSLLTFNLNAKEIYTYSCPINADTNAEISLLDKNNPALGVSYKKNKVLSCELLTTDHKEKNLKSKITSETYVMDLGKCTYYQESFKEKIQLNSTIVLKIDKKVAHLILLENQNTLSCQPK